MKLEPWRETYLVFGAPYFGQEERDEVLACIDSGWVGSGPRLERFEREFAAYLGSTHAVGVNSCTAALTLAFRSLDLEPGAEVITTGLTFCATANSIVHSGLVPVFVDCDLGTQNISPDKIEAAITKRTKAIVPVHMAGRPCDMDAIMKIAKAHNLYVVEDCAHAIESTIGGKHCGLFGDIGCFSFYVTKNISTVEGGMLVSADETRVGRIKTCALHGMSKEAWKRYSDEGFIHYSVSEPGFKFNLTDIAASFGIHQLARIDVMRARRVELWNYYMNELSDLPLTLPEPVGEGIEHSCHLFSCLIDDRQTSLTRDELVTRLHKLRIGTGVHYTALHLHPYYRTTFGYKEGDLPNVESIGARTFSIPLSYSVSDSDAEDVVKALKLLLVGS